MGSRVAGSRVAGSGVVGMVVVGMVVEECLVVMHILHIVAFALCNHDLHNHNNKLLIMLTAHIVFGWC